MLHRLVERHLDDLLESFRDPDNPESSIPAFVEKEFRAYLTCGRPEFGFIKLRCEKCQHVHPLPFSCKGRAICPSCATRRMEDTATHLVDHVLPDVPLRQWVLSPPFELRGILAARGEVLSKMVRIFVDEIFKQMRAWAQSQGIKIAQCGAVTFLQRFTRSLTVHPHLHVIVLDGVFTKADDESEPEFHRCPPPTPRDLMELLRNVFLRMERFLRRQGFVGPKTDEMDEADLTPIDRWYESAQREPSLLTPTKVPRSASSGVQLGGFSVHAAVTVPAGDKKRRYELCRYVARPLLAEDQLCEAEDGRIALTMRRKTKSGQSVVLLEPLRLLRRLAWLIPPPRQHQVRFHGVLAPAAQWRSLIVPPPPFKLQLAFPLDNIRPESTAYRTPWAQLIARVYDINAERCPKCGGHVRPVGAVTDPDEARRFLNAFGRTIRARGPPLQLSLPFLRKSA